MIRTALTEYGPVRGLPAADPRITSYKGIPYAAPPVGKNRWRAPQPPAAWTDELEAYIFSPIPMQAPILADPDSLYDREFHVDPDTPMSEDCLYLNIWAPADGRKNMPVYVWYYGGGLQVGYTNEMEFDGERMARRGIVVVTVNYRLNCFGFLCHPEITAESPEAPANFGFLDQQAATRWVKRNIAAFGGDPERITIGGQSAGGMSVAAQLTCRENKGLFQGAVIQSGVFSSPYPSRFGLTHTLAEAEENGKAFFASLGVKTLAEARALDALTLRNGVLAWEKTHGWATTFGEALDGVFRKRGTQEWYMDPDRLDVPLLLGNTCDEFIEYPDAGDEESLKAFAARYGDRQQEFLDCFPHPADTGSIRSAGGVCTIEFALRRAAALTGSKMFAYFFKADMPGYDHPGTFHSSDLWFTFETLAKCWRPFTGAHYELARQMCDYWCNFIRSGDPNGTDSHGETLPEWPEWNGTERMVFDTRPHACDAAPSPLVKLLLEESLKQPS